MQRIAEFFGIGTQVMIESRFLLPDAVLVQFRRDGSDDRILVLMQEVQASEDWIGFAQEYERRGGAEQVASDVWRTLFAGSHLRYRRRRP